MSSMRTKAGLLQAAELLQLRKALWLVTGGWSGRPCVMVYLQDRTLFSLLQHLCLMFSSPLNNCSVPSSLSPFDLNMLVKSTTLLSKIQMLSIQIVMWLCAVKRSVSFDQQAVAEAILTVHPPLSSSSPLLP